VKEGHWLGIQYPRVARHEIAGRIDEVGANVTNWKKGQRVGAGWYGGIAGKALTAYDRLTKHPQT
jgi:D-arabinose 1-dehydrogenase-like Zn-dependent alcohol dehydrogenase